MRAIEYAITLLKNGKLVAIPTETVYGLGADARNPIAVQKIYTAKGRPSTNPLIIHIPNPDAIIDFAIDVPDDAWQLAKHFWPGPLTLILKRHPSVPLIVTGGQETVALRIPNHPLTLELLQAFNGGIAAPSANPSGRISPTTAEHVQEGLGAAVDFILDGGACTIGIESTIVSCISDPPMILRQGSISAEMLNAVLGKDVLEPSAKHNIHFPGSQLSHYAPHHPLYLLDKESLLQKVKKLSEENKAVSVLSFEKKPVDKQFLITEWIAVSHDPIHYAQQLYHTLHHLDKTKCDYILIERPPNTREWLAIRDRLQRAAYSTN